MTGHVYALFVIVLAAAEDIKVNYWRLLVVILPVLGGRLSRLLLGGFEALLAAHRLLAVSHLAYSAGGLLGLALVYR